MMVSHLWDSETFRPKTGPVQFWDPKFELATYFDVNLYQISSKSDQAFASYSGTNIQTKCKTIEFCIDLHYIR
jgi:hypothetical protein